MLTLEITGKENMSHGLREVYGYGTYMTIAKSKKS